MRPERLKRQSGPTL